MTEACLSANREAAQIEEEQGRQQHDVERRAERLAKVERAGGQPQRLNGLHIARGDWTSAGNDDLADDETARDRRHGSGCLIAQELGALLVVQAIGNHQRPKQVRHQLRSALGQLQADVGRQRAADFLHQLGTDLALHHLLEHSLAFVLDELPIQIGELQKLRRAIDRDRDVTGCAQVAQLLLGRGVWVGAHGGDVGQAAAQFLRLLAGDARIGRVVDRRDCVGSNLAGLIRENCAHECDRAGGEDVLRGHFAQVEADGGLTREEGHRQNGHGEDRARNDQRRERAPCADAVPGGGGRVSGGVHRMGAGPCPLPA